MTESVDLSASALEEAIANSYLTGKETAKNIYKELEQKLITSLIKVLIDQF